MEKTTPAPPSPTPKPTTPAPPAVERTIQRRWPRTVPDKRVFPRS